MHGDDDLIEWQPASGVIPMGENGREGNGVGKQIRRDLADELANLNLLCVDVCEGKAYIQGTFLNPMKIKEMSIHFK